MESWENVKIEILNKTLKEGKVNVYTTDGTAKAGDDYEKIDQVVHFTKGQKYQYVEVKIYDDDEVEPDEDFFVRLRDARTGKDLKGGDTKTKVTILDDDTRQTNLKFGFAKLEHEVSEDCGKAKI